MARTKVQAELIADNALTATLIPDGTLTATQLAANSVDTAEIVTGSIDTIHIAANNVTAAKIVSDGIETRHLHSNVISGLSAVTPVAGDYLLAGDTSDSDNLKKILVSGITGLVSGGASDLDGLSDAKKGGTDFTNSLLIGHQTTGNLASADANTGVGIGALDALTGGENNVAVGMNAGSSNTLGDKNVFLGAYAGN